LKRFHGVEVFLAEAKAGFKYSMRIEATAVAILQHYFQIAH